MQKKIIVGFVLAMSIIKASDLTFPSYLTANQFKSYNYEFRVVYSKLKEEIENLNKIIPFLNSDRNNIKKELDYKREEIYSRLKLKKRRASKKDIIFLEKIANKYLVKINQLSAKIEQFEKIRADRFDLIRTVESREYRKRFNNLSIVYQELNRVGLYDIKIGDK